MLSYLFDVKHWRAGILLCFVVAMFATPADPVSTLLVAGALCGLYFLVVGLLAYSRHERAS